MRGGGRWVEKKTEEIEHTPLGVLLSVKRKGKKSATMCRLPTTDLGTQFSSSCWILGGEMRGSGFGQIKMKGHPSGDSFIFSANICCVVIPWQALCYAQ